jgi:carboxypeptidase family protein
MSARSGPRYLRFRIRRAFPPTLLAVALAVAHPCLGHGVSAQAPPAAPVGAIVGQVTDTLGTPLPYCSVHLEDAPSPVICDSVGRFRLAGIARQVATFEVRRLGYVPSRFTVPLVRNSDTRVTIQLLSIATLLEPIAVWAEPASMFTPWVAEHGFYDRMHGATGAIFITPEEWEALKPQRVSDALQIRPGISVTYGREGANGPIIPVVRGRDLCLLNVFVDGLEVAVYDKDPRLDNPGGSLSMLSAGGIEGTQMSIGRLKPVTGLGIDAFVLPWDVAAVEIYPSGPQTPIQFRTSNECGAIVIWTKVTTSGVPADSARPPRPPR